MDIEDKELTPEELAESIVSDVQLVDNSWSEAKEVAKELKEYIAVTIKAERTKVERLQAGLTAIEARWRAASQDSCFRSHYRETMEMCADELRDLLAGADDREVQDEISKAFEADER